MVADKSLVGWVLAVALVGVVEGRGSLRSVELRTDPHGVRTFTTNLCIPKVPPLLP